MSNFIWEEKQAPSSPEPADDGLRYDTVDTSPQAPTQSKHWSAEMIGAAIQKSAVDESWEVEGMEKAEKIPGGLASGKKASSFDSKALAAGVKVEAEHTKDPKTAREIAMDHLTEDPKYYEKLARMEKSKSNSKADAAIRAFLKKNPKPDDSAVHALAGKLGMEVDDLEEEIYAMLGKKLKKSGLNVLGEYMEKAATPVGGTLKKALPSEEAKISPEKARQILHDGEVHGKPLTEQQRKFFGAIGGHLPAPKGKKAEKSMSGIDALGNHLEKARPYKPGMPRRGDVSRYTGPGTERAKKKPGGGPFMGPKGGKWADPKHTIPWKEAAKPKEKAPSKQLKSAIADLTEADDDARHWEGELKEAKTESDRKEAFEEAEASLDQAADAARKVSSIHKQLGNKAEATKAAKLASKYSSRSEALVAKHRGKPTAAQAASVPKTEKSMSSIDTLKEHLEKAAPKDDGKPGKSLAETSTKELQSTLADIKHRMGTSRDPGLEARQSAIQAELKKRGGKTEKSMTSALDTLSEHVETAEPLSKGMIGGYGMGWAERFIGTPFEVEALQCIKNLNKIRQERNEVYRKHDKPWHERQRMDPVERAKLDKKRSEELKKCDAKEDAEGKKQSALEEKYLDWRIERAKEAKKSEGADGDEPLVKADDKGPKRPPKEYREAGATERKDYAVPGEYKYPIDTEAHTRAAISYFSKPKNAGVYPVAQQKTIWGRIKKAAKKFKIELGKESGPPSVEKSADGIDALEEHLMKSDIPTGQPTKLPTGESGNPEDGGPLAGVGKPTGSEHAPNPDPDQDAQGNPKDVPTPKTQDWGLEEEARRVFGGIGGTMKSMGPLDQDRAIAEARLRKGQGDVHPYRTSAVHGDAEARIKELSKGGANEQDPRNAIIAKDVLCKGCGNKHPAMLTACPGCGEGTIGREVLIKSNPGVVMEDPRGAPVLRRPMREPDILIKG